MTKKLYFSEFLRIYEESEPICPAPIKGCTYSYSLDAVLTELLEHTEFLLNGTKYTNVMVSSHSAYFYDGDRFPHLILFESILDIKRKENIITVFTDTEPIYITLIKE